MAHHKPKYLRHFLRDLLILICSIFAAFLLVRLGLIENFLNATSSSLILSSFIAGAFFTSIFTIAPAGVALVAISDSFSPLAVAFFGALGSMCVDFIIFNFIRKDISEDLDGFTRMTFRKHLLKAFHFGMIKWVAFIAGILLLAAPPVPDEAGLFLLGVSKVNTKYLPMIFFAANFLGIFALVSIAAAL